MKIYKNPTRIRAAPKPTPNFFFASQQKKKRMPTPELCISCWERDAVVTVVENTLYVGTNTLNLCRICQAKQTIVMFNKENGIAANSDRGVPQELPVPVEISELATISSACNREPFDYCPGCGMVCFKDGGCKHVTCSRCNAQFTFSGLGRYPDQLREPRTQYEEDVQLFVTRYNGSFRHVLFEKCFMLLFAVCSLVTIIRLMGVSHYGIEYTYFKVFLTHYKSDINKPAVVLWCIHMTFLPTLCWLQSVNAFPTTSLARCSVFVRVSLSVLCFLTIPFLFSPSRLLFICLLLTYAWYFLSGIFLMQIQESLERRAMQQSTRVDVV